MALHESTVARMQSEIALTTVYSDAWRVYRRLMRPSILTATIVFAVIGLASR